MQIDYNKYVVEDCIKKIKETFYFDELSKDILNFIEYKIDIIPSPKGYVLLMDEQELYKKLYEFKIKISHNKSDY